MVATADERLTLLSSPYEWVDTAEGGWNRRNNVLRLSDFRPANTSKDTGRTWLRYDTGLKDHCESNKGSVGGYQGACGAEFVPVDLDDKEDLNRALCDARRILDHLTGWLGIPREAVRCFFSGGKGFGIEIPAALFGGFEPSADLPDQIGRLVSALFKTLTLPTLDRTLYEHLRLLRWPNTKHQKTGRYKIPLTGSEIDRLDCDAIRALATAPRLDFPASESTPDAIPALAALWQAAREGEPESTPAISKWPVAAGVKTARIVEAGSGADPQIAPILAGCAWLRNALDTAKTLAEPQWYAMLGIVGRCEDGHRLTHEFSSPHPDYDEAGTDAKLARALSEAGPRTCPDIRKNGGESFCSVCPSWGAVKSPIVLGRSGTSDSKAEPVPPFPMDTLPPAVREYVEEAAASQRCAVDLVAVPALVFAGAVLHSSVRIAVKRRWDTSPTLYAACVGAVGDGKSPALRAARYPLDVFEREIEDDYRGRYAAYQSQLTEWKVARKAERGPEPRKPVREQYFVTDCTMEALAGYLANQEHPVVYIADELVAWIKACDMYRGGQGTDRQNWLSIWSNGPIKTGRRTREGEYVERASVCVVGGVQPGIVKSVGEGEDGLCERILWSFPPPGAGGWSDDSISEEAECRYLTVFRQVRDKRMATPIGLSAEAQDRFKAWFNENEAALRRSAGRERSIRSKLSLHAQRFALVLYCLKHPGETQPGEVIDLETLEAAFTLTAYFLAHALTVMKLMKTGEGKGAVDKVRALAGRIYVGLRERGGWVSKQGIYEITGRNTAAGDLDEALTRLQENGQVESQPCARGNGRPSEQWRAIEGASEGMAAA